MPIWLTLSSLTGSAHKKTDDTIFFEILVDFTSVSSEKVPETTCLRSFANFNKS